MSSRRCELDVGKSGEEIVNVLCGRGVVGVARVYDRAAEDPEVAKVVFDYAMMPGRAGATRGNLGRLTFESVAETSKGIDILDIISKAGKERPLDIGDTGITQYGLFPTSEQDCFFAEKLGINAELPIVLIGNPAEEF